MHRYSVRGIGYSRKTEIGRAKSFTLFLGKSDVYLRVGTNQP
jgi:hypothetical protein